MAAAAAGSRARRLNLLAAVVRRATEFLLARRKPDGLWRDFDTLAGASDEWVSAYTACALGTVPDPVAFTAAEDAWRRLVAHRRWSAGRGYNRCVPADADSTVWFLRLAELVRRSTSLPARRARRFLAGHLRPGGGIATYSIPGPIRRFIGAARDTRLDGWCRDHVCVTAAAATLTEFNSYACLREYLRNHQRDDGRWDAYWWCDPEFATSIAVDALSRNSTVPDRRATAAAAAWAKRRHASSLGQGSSPFALASTIRLLAASGLEKTNGDMTLALVEALATCQRPDGSWEPSARLRIPPPDVIDPETYDGWAEGGRGGGSILVDDQAVFTTATALSGLMEVQRTVRD